MSLRDAVRRPIFIIGAIIALIMLFLAIFGRRLSPNDPTLTNIANVLEPPSRRYPLGTDTLGRCVLSRLLSGAGATLGSALFVEAFLFVFGVSVGVGAGYFGGVFDHVLLVVLEALFAFPSIILAIVIAGLLGPGLSNLILAMCCVYWVGHARVARSLARTVREKPFVLSAIASGSSKGKILMRHILPHVIPQMAIYATNSISSLLISISSLSFIGLGVRPPAPEWGAILADARNYMSIHPIPVIAAVVCILMAVSCFHLIGESFRDASDVRHSRLGIVLGKKEKKNA